MCSSDLRNGGEVLDHFFDPLSFCVIIWGIGACCESYNMAIICVLGIYCNATILFQEAMIMKTLEMKAIGPNEARVLYMCLGAVLSYLTICLDDSEFIGEQYCFLQSLSARSAATGFMWLSTALTIGTCTLFCSCQSAHSTKRLVRVADSANASLNLCLECIRTMCT